MGLRSFIRSWLNRPETQPEGGKVRSFIGRLFRGAPPEVEQRITEAPPEDVSEAVESSWDEWFGGADDNLGKTSPSQWDEGLAATWHKMASTNVDEIRYVPDTLQVLFLNSYAYEYYNVPARVFMDFLSTDSPGRYVWNVLRADGYAYKRAGTGEIPINPTGNRNRVANVVRTMLPEEVERNRTILDRLVPGTVAERLTGPLRERSYQNVQGEGTRAARERSRRLAESILGRRR